MVSKVKIKILAGAVALALTGTAMGTTLDNTTTGDLFINVVDTSNNTSFLYDTGTSQASFNASSTQSYDFSKDSNYTAFIAGAGNDLLDYSILSSTKVGSPATATTQFTSNASPSAVTGIGLSQSNTNIGGFFFQANQVPSTTTNSALLGPNYTWGQTSAEYIVATNLGVPYTQPGSGVDAIVGTAINFYSETSSTLRSNANGSATLSTLPGTWNEVGGVATYTAAGGTTPPPVPLPAPLVLLLSGLGLMGVISRRGKAVVAA